MDKQISARRLDLINRFQKWFDTHPADFVIASECANITETYAMEQLEKYSLFLEKEGYIDIDWRAEEPLAIDEFLKLINNDMYYIISLTHTMKHDKYLTLWRSNNAGYCYSKEAAGLYENPKKGYHDCEDNMPIFDLDAEKLFMLLPYDGQEKNMIPNIKLVWDILRVKMTKYGLKRLKSDEKSL